MGRRHGWFPEWDAYRRTLEITQTPTGNPDEYTVFIRDPSGKRSWSATGKPDAIIPIMLQMIRGDWNAERG